MRGMGIYKAVVAAVGDPDGLNRVRVRVLRLHPEESPIESLPWAEICAPSGKARGMFLRYRVGEPVFVMLEGGDRQYPVIMGGVITSSGGLPDTPIEQQVTDNDDVQVWIGGGGEQVILDGRGNKSSVTIKAGGADAQVVVQNGEVTMRASGAVKVEAGTVSVTAATAAVSAGTVNIDAERSSPLGKDTGAVNLRANDEVNITADPTVPSFLPETTTSGRVNIGGHNPKIRGMPLPGGLPTQANEVNVRSRVINIGVGPTGVLSDILASASVDADPAPATAAANIAGLVGPSIPAPLPPTTVINIRSSLKVNVAAPTVDVNGALAVNLFSQKSIAVSALSDCSIVGAAGVSVDSAKEVIVRAPTVSIGALIGDLNLTAVNGKISLLAPVGGVEIAASMINSKTTTSTVFDSAGEARFQGAGPVIIFSATTTTMQCGSATLVQTPADAKWTAPIISAIGMMMINGSFYSLHTHSAIGLGSPTTPPLS